MSSGEARAERNGTAGISVRGEMETGGRQPAPATIRLPTQSGSHWQIEELRLALPICRAQELWISRELEEQRRNAEAKRLLVNGIWAVGAASVVLVALLFFFPTDAEHFRVFAFFMAFFTYVVGTAAILLSMIMLGGRAHLVFGDQDLAAKFLAVSCTVLSVLTLFSVVVLLPSDLFKYYIYLTEALVILLLTTWVHGNEARHGEQEEDLVADSKVTCGITAVAFSTLMGIFFGGSMIYGAAVDDKDQAACLAIFFLCATAILGVFVVTLWSGTPGIIEPAFQRPFVSVIRPVNYLLLCFMAFASLAAAFVILRYRLLAAFAPFVIAAAAYIILSWHRLFGLRGRAHPGDASYDQQENQQLLKVIKNIANMVTMIAMPAIFAASCIGQKDNSQLAGARDASMVVLTSALLSSLGIRLVAAAPGSAKAHLAQVVKDPKVLISSCVAWFAATAVICMYVQM